MSQADAVTSTTFVLTDQYAAGFFDGEGCLSLMYFNRRIWRSDPTKRMKAFRLAVTMTNTDRPVLEHFQKRFGGQLYSAPSRSPRHKPTHHWRINGFDGQGKFLACIRPYALVKLKQIEIAVEYLTTSVSAGKRVPQEFWDTRVQCYEKMQALNKRGSWQVHLSRPPLKPHRGNTMGRPSSSLG